MTSSDVATFLVCLQYLVSFFQCATKVGHNQVLTRGHELGVWEEGKGGGGGGKGEEGQEEGKGGGEKGGGGKQRLAYYNPTHPALVDIQFVFSIIRKWKSGKNG